MNFILQDNPTREKILMLLKKSGPLPIDKLSKELNITSMGIRQHLLSLERKGLIEYVTQRKGIGRPAFLYKLTEEADTLFPKAYHDFILHTFKDIEKNEGRDKIDTLFKWRKHRVLKEFRDFIANKPSFPEKVYGVRDLLAQKGYIVECTDDNNHYTLKQFNCPIYKLASSYSEACKYELQTYRDLLGKDISRDSCIIEGNPSCTYHIPKVLQ